MWVSFLYQYVVLIDKIYQIPTFLFKTIKIYNKVKFMKLCISSLENKQIWKEKGYKLPKHDIKSFRRRTLEESIWLYFGAVNIFRAFLAVYSKI